MEKEKHKNGIVEEYLLCTRIIRRVKRRLAVILDVETQYYSKEFNLYRFIDENQLNHTQDNFDNVSIKLHVAEIYRMRNILYLDI
tara:strand:+ start:620 stop:874 length:255 start_codon:yes stop_codon:yes gene_type:complete